MDLFGENWPDPIKSECIKEHHQIGIEMKVQSKSSNGVNRAG